MMSGLAAVTEPDEVEGVVVVGGAAGEGWGRGWKAERREANKRADRVRGSGKGRSKISFSLFNSLRSAACVSGLKIWA